MVGKFVTVLTILALVISAILPAQVFADDDIGYEARVCRDLGILKGHTGIVDDEYLDTRPSRLQAAIMFLRLKGLEQDALDYYGGKNFKDAGVIAWEEGRNVLSYLKEHPELGWIGDGVNFMPYSLIDSRAYYKVLLESLGYKQKIDGRGDFDWESVLEFAEEKGLDKVADVKNFTVRSLAIATVEALNTKMKGSRKKLIEHLVDIGDVNKRDAISLGLYSGKLDAEVKDVRAISNSKVEVVFKESIDGTDAEDEELYEIDHLDIKKVSMKNEYSIIIDTSAMKENYAYTLEFNDKNYNFRGLKKDKTAPKLIKVECKDTDLVELTFDRILDNETAQDTDTYTISGASVRSAELDSTNTKVRLTTRGIDSRRSYELKIRGIKNGDGVVTKSITKKFSGKKDTSAPKLSKLTVLNNVRLLLEFSDSNGLDKSTAQDERNYRITYKGGSLDVESAEVKDRDDDGLWDSVYLVTESQDAGEKYTLIVEDIKDGSVSGNSITKAIKKEFIGKAEDRTGPSIARDPKAITNTMVEVVFSDSNALDVESACDIDCYEIDENLEILDARIKDPDDLYSTAGRTVLLITEEMDKSERYTLRISGICDEFGNEMKSSSSNKAYRFKGIGEDRTPPYITYVRCIDSRTLELYFDNTLDEESAENIINYRIDGLALVTKAVLLEDEKTVRLTVSSLSSNRNHTVLVNNIKDLTGNAISNVSVNVHYSGSLYDDDPPEVDYIEAVNKKEVWIHFDEEVFAENAAMKASGINFKQSGSVLEERTAVVMIASESLHDDKEYEVTELTGIQDMRGNKYVLEYGLDFYGTDDENEPPEVDDWDQMDARSFRVVFSEPVLLKGNGVSGINNPGGVNIEWKAVLNPDDEDEDEAYCTVDYIAKNRNIPPDKEFRFNFAKMVKDYAGLEAYGGITILESYMEDDEEPDIEYVEAINCKKVQIEFSEAIREPGSYKITYEDDNGKLRTIGIDYVEVDPEDNTRVNIYTVDKLSDEYYYILEPKSAAVDIAGNKLDIDDLEIDFEGSSVMSSDFIQEVERLDSKTFRVIKSSRISKVNSLYKLDSNGNAIGENLIESASRISSNVYKVVSKETLLKNVGYRITVDGISYKFSGWAGKSASEPALPYKSSSKEITSFSFKNLAGGIGEINEVDRIISLTVPYGTDVSRLTASFKCSEYAVVMVGGKEQISGETTNDFSREVVYTVIAQDGSAQNYTVVVTAAKEIDKCIKEFRFERPESAIGEIDEENRIITVTVPYRTDFSKLVPVITIPDNTEISVKSGKAPDFSEPVEYIVTAKDGTSREYTVIVKRAPSSENLMTVFAFRYLDPVIKAEVGHEQKIIELAVPYGTDRTKLVASFRVSPEAVVNVNGVVQISGETEQDFTSPVKYIVTAQDGTTREYTVIVTAAPSSEKLMKEFGFAVPQAAGIINEAEKKISVTVPYGTALNEVVAVFISSDNSKVFIGSDEQKSGVSIRDFTNPVMYTVVAQDGSTQNYTVTVTSEAIHEKKLTSFGFNLNGTVINAVIDEANHTVYAEVPRWTVLKKLTAFFTYRGKSVYVGEVQQYSGITVNDFRRKVVYRVTAFDDSYVDYEVIVKKPAGGA
ncbi:MAG: hypothetical protein GX301_03495 [Gracilibacteraceae bacterium]|nr:hypothetical protein [Gracilibacteraceae bacterium]